jgi:hypothetical protein
MTARGLPPGSRCAAAVCLLALAAAVAAGAGCPPAEQTLERIRALPWERTTRFAVHGAAPPAELAERAAERPGRVAAAKDGKQGFAQAVLPLPRERLWKAVNDEDRYAEDLGLAHSEVVEGTPRGTERLLLQSFDRLGVGRWWVDRVTLGGELQQQTRDQLWELAWRDAFDEVDLSRPPVATVAARWRRVEWTRGAWVFAALGPDCTFVDYFLWTDPGGWLSTFQALGAKGALADTVEGLARHAREGLDPVPPGSPPFVQPDGTPLP